MVPNRVTRPNGIKGPPGPAVPAEPPWSSPRTPLEAAAAKRPRLHPGRTMKAFYDLFLDPAVSSGASPGEASGPEGSEAGEAAEDPEHASPGASQGAEHWQSEERKRVRAIRNRHAAYASRERKRRYVETLEQTNRLLKEESTSMRSRMETLENERTLLQHEVSTLRSDLEALKQLVRCGSLSSTLNATLAVHPADPQRDVSGSGDDLAHTNDKEPEQRMPSSGLPALNGSHSAHLPSATSGHLLVSADEKTPMLPARMSPPHLCHVLRLRVRYLRPSPQPPAPGFSTPNSSLSIPKGPSMTSKTRSPSGTRSSRLRPLSGTRRLQKRQRRNSASPVNRTVLRMLWEQICRRRFPCPRERP